MNGLFSLLNERSITWNLSFEVALIGGIGGDGCSGDAAFLLVIVIMKSVLNNVFDTATVIK